MSLYTVILFLHIVGAIGYFLGIGLWLFILLGWRRMQRVEQVRSLIHLNDLSAPFAAASAVLLLGTGLYLALTAWSLLTSWILVALISLLLMVPTDPGFIGSEWLCTAYDGCHSDICWSILWGLAAKR